MPILPRLTASPRRTRRTRRIRLLSLRWQRQALFVLGGITVGLAAVGLALAADRAGELLGAVLVWQPFAALVLTPAGFAASNWLARQYFPNSGGSGIPQAIAARELDVTAVGARLVSVRTALGEMALLLLGLLCGAYRARRPDGAGRRRHRSRRDPSRAAAVGSHRRCDDRLNPDNTFR